MKKRDPWEGQMTEPWTDWDFRKQWREHKWITLRQYAIAVLIALITTATAWLITRATFVVIMTLPLGLIVPLMTNRDHEKTGARIFANVWAAIVATLAYYWMRHSGPMR